MALRCCAILILALSMAWAEAGEARKKVSEYPVQAETGAGALGAEFMVHSFSAGRSTYLAQGFLTVEVGIYPKHPSMVALSQFKLRVNGKKDFVLAQTPQFVASAMNHPEWGSPRSVSMGGGLGNAGVILGGPRGAGGPVPRPRAPEPTTPGAGDAEPQPSAQDLVVAVALPEGETKFPVGGYLYFPFKAKSASIKKLELFYEGPLGPITIKLR